MRENYINLLYRIAFWMEHGNINQFIDFDQLSNSVESVERFLLFNRPYCLSFVARVMYVHTFLGNIVLETGSTLFELR